MRSNYRSLACILLLAVLILFVVPRPESIPVAGWRMLSIFLCTILALILRPIDGGAAVLIALTCTIVLGVLSPAQALSGYANTTAWLLLSAFFIARAIIVSGLARRIALLFVRAIGHTSLGLGYSLIASDIVLAAVIPSTAARVGGVVLPVTQSIAGIYKSFPGPTASLLGTYLMATIYQGDMIACAMFITGQASNPLGAQLAKTTANINMDWFHWLWAALAPALVAALAIPWLIYRITPPEIRHTPEASESARKELLTMGTLSRKEKTVLAVFVVVCLLWATASIHGIQATTVALGGVGALLVSRVLAWEDVSRDHAAWDVFVWYGGLLRMGEALVEFLFYANLSASLTHYGTTHSPMIFATGYVSLRLWWRTGFLVSIANLLIWTSIGLLWWKLIGLW